MNTLIESIIIPYNAFISVQSVLYRNRYIIGAQICGKHWKMRFESEARLDQKHAPDEHRI